MFCVGNEPEPNHGRGPCWIVSWARLSLTCVLFISCALDTYNIDIPIEANAPNGINTDSKKLVAKAESQIVS